MAGDIQPYAGLSDSELAELAGQATDIRLRLAELSPGEVAQTLIDHGMPADAARMQVSTPGLRTFAAKFHLDCQDMLFGDAEARARVEYCEAAWADMNRGRERAEAQSQGQG